MSDDASDVGIARATLERMHAKEGLLYIILHEIEFKLHNRISALSDNASEISAARATQEKVHSKLHVYLASRTKHCQAPP